MSVRSSVSVRDMSSVTEKNPPFIPWDNPDNIVSAETVETVHKVVICGATEVVMILGILGNIVNLVVFTRQGLKDRVTLMLFCLALVDLLNLLCYFSINISCFIHPIDPILARNVRTLQYPQVLYISLMASILSMSLVTVLSLDRCLAIAMPLKASHILTYRRTVAVTVIVSAVIITTYIPSLWTNAVTWLIDPVSNRPVAQLVPTKFALQHPVYTYILDIFIPAVKVACIVAVVITCSITVKTIRAARKLRAEMAEVKLNQAEIQITVMLLLVCTAMVLSLIPDLVGTVVFWTVPDFFMFRKYHNIFLFCQNIIYFFRMLNSALNFFMYVLLSSKFRATLMELLPCRQK